jgi:hypothetical protein
MKSVRSNFDLRFVASGFVVGFFVSAIQINLWDQLIFLTAIVYFAAPYIVTLLCGFLYLKYKHNELQFLAFTVGIILWMVFAALAWLLVSSGVLAR